ncbi:glycosyl hydrolase [Lactobacillus nasalidis]|uniref:Glycosyl hydrolase n=1 Tax=Lactobacillus nasalidis TaxID=2797258 RepID=A0ABQ3WD49_9LACO|nr:glycoside hydrolase family 125 protein [Lactobacillus nasalidis]GHV98066.1 glycosyl hydrolase [Lactobacillus nasalidis]GHV99705.1 glycosyl hydrolase [Lactobacillus nasalidis]GHW02137.1 glycosyl hydrolase [Lactobacillus nasalidis]
MKELIDEQVKRYMENIKSSLPNDQRLYRVFERTYLNTLTEALVEDDQGSMFVLTGDIPAMWQRDSAAQLRPYIPLAKTDSKIRNVIVKVIKRQFFNMNLDPYANAFNEFPNNHGHQTDKTKMGPWIWERKFEIDSLCYPVQLAYLLYKNTGEKKQFNKDFVSGIRKVLVTFKQEQHHESSPYSFERECDIPTDTLANGGKGAPVAYTGMIWSGFRPSDDACTYGYLIPANMFAVVILRYICELFSSVLDYPEIVEEATKVKEEIEEGIKKYGLVEYRGRLTYAYEVDGLGNTLMMDDSNSPSLLSAPYFGYSATDDQLYQNTRRFILSVDNPYFYLGEFCSGQGSPHTPKGYVWPLALALQGLTSNSESEKLSLLYSLVTTTAGTEMIHESFDPNDPSKFTRPWFSWGNMMYCELLLDYLGQRVKC